MSFYNEALKTFVGIAQTVISNESQKEINSESFLDHMIKTLDMFLKLDTLKSMKAALNNDFASLRRASQFIQSNDNQEELNNIHMFLSQQGSIITGLRDKLQSCQGIDEILTIIVHRCVDNFDSQRYLYGEEKHSFIRVSALGLFLMDDKTGKLGKVKNLSLSKVCKLFKRYPFIPLYGDMTFSTKTILEKSVHLKKNESEWMVKHSTLESSYLLTNDTVESIKKDYLDFTSRYQILINKVRFFKREKEKCDKDPNYEKEKRTLYLDLPTEMKVEAKNLSLQGLKFLASWTSSILEQSAWKYGHPQDSEKCEIDALAALEFQKEKETEGESKKDEEKKDKEKPTVLDYERVVRFNYTQQERSNLVQVIAIIKSTEKLLVKNTSLLLPHIQSVIHDELQEFIQVTLVDLLNKTNKNKRPVHTTLVDLRNLAADWLDGKVPDFSKQTTKGTKVETHKRNVGPSPTQLHLIRAIISSISSERSPGMKKTSIFGSVDFDSSQIKILDEFYDKSYFWPYLMAFSTSCRKSADLADLWYREFYLELSRRIQFPIKMSLPWLLAEDIIEKTDTTLMESILYPLDIYNDAAYRALFVLQRKFLYDEIEAEVNLVFDQLIYKLSEQIYSYFKILAVNILLDNKFRVVIERVQKESRFSLPMSRYDVILSQKCINLLGRTVDMNFLISQRVNISIRENLTKAIQRFEAGDLTTLVELESMVENVRLTHKLLSQYLTLDPFNNIMAEVNESSSTVSFEGKITRHVFEELCMDIFPTYIFNSFTQRFVRGPPIKDKEREPYEREKQPRIPLMYLYGTKGFNTSMNNINDQYRTFIGHEHVRSMIRLVGQDSLGLIVETCIAFMEDKIYNDLGPYVKALMEALPPQIKLQPAAYGLFGIYSYFTAQFKDFISYRELKTDVFNGFRTIGNCISFLILLDASQMPKNIQTSMSIAPFIGIKPLSKNLKQKRQNDSEVPDAEIMDVFIRLDNLQEAPLVQTISNFVKLDDKRIRSSDLLKEQPNQAYKAIKIYDPPREIHSLIQQVLDRMTKILENIKDEWKGTSGSDRLIKFDSSKEFYRLWAVLQFIYCIEDMESSNYSDIETFGHGFTWGGSSLVYLFGQHLRFDAFNFTDHVLNTDTLTEGLDKNRNMVEKFLVNAKLLQSLNTQIFSTLKTFYPLQMVHNENFTPPDSDDFSKIRVVSNFNSSNESQDTKQEGSKLQEFKKKNTEY